MIRWLPFLNYFLKNISNDEYKIKLCFIKSRCVDKNSFLPNSGIYKKNETFAARSPFTFLN